VEIDVEIDVERTALVAGQCRVDLIAVCGLLGRPQGANHGTVTGGIVVGRGTEGENIEIRGSIESRGFHATIGGYLVCELQGGGHLDAVKRCGAWPDPVDGTKANLASLEIIEGRIATF
jgi:hypothetical protein